jgi:hypothetical protein
MALPLNGLFGFGGEGGGEIMVLGAEPGDGSLPGAPAGPMPGITIGGKPSGSGMVSAGDWLAPAASEAGIPTSAKARVANRSANGLPSPRTRRSRAARRARKSLVI